MDFLDPPGLHGRSKSFEVELPSQLLRSLNLYLLPSKLRRVWIGALESQLSISHSHWARFLQIPLERASHQTLRMFLERVSTFHLHRLKEFDRKLQ